MSTPIPAKWKFVAEADACDICQSYHGDIFETAEIWEEFPNAMPLFDDVIMPNVHPNCRCQLLLQSQGVDEVARSKILLKDPRGSLKRSVQI